MAFQYGQPMQPMGFGYQPSAVPPRVHGEAGANAYWLPLGGHAVVFDDEDPYFWDKSVDASGVQHCERYRYERDPSENEPSPDPFPAYATREDLSALMSKVDEMSRRMEELHAGVDIPEQPKPKPMAKSRSRRPGPAEGQS